MKRLIDLPADDRLTARAHELVRAMGPTQFSEVRMRRLRSAMDTADDGPSRWPRRLTLGVVLFATSAAAASGGSLITALTQPEEPSPAASVASAAPALIASPRSVAARAVPAAPAEPEASAPPPASLPTTARAAARAPAASSSDVKRVHEAAKALRRDRDPERALALLEQSGAGSGPLAEEALALRIEAALARGDQRAADLARTYLAQYPNGRYQALAKKALSSRKP